MYAEQEYALAPSSSFHHHGSGRTTADPYYDHYENYDYDYPETYRSFYPHHTTHHTAPSETQLTYQDDSYSNGSQLQMYRSGPFPSSSRACFDPLADMRPGPIAAGYVPEKTTRSDNATSASVFLERELSPLVGRVHVLYESVRKYGRFDMREGKIMLDRGESDREYLEALGRLWQIGDGYVYVRQKMSIREVQDAVRKRGDDRDVRDVVSFIVYHIDHNSYVKLPGKEAADIISKDPTWKDDIRSYDLKFD